MVARSVFKKLALMLAVQGAASLASAQATPSPWKLLGPWGGTVKSVRWSKGGDTLFASVGNSIYRSPGANGKWELVVRTKENSIITDFAVDGQVVIASRDGNITVTRDMGASWKAIGTGVMYEHLAYRGGTLYLNKADTIYRSESLGDTIVKATGTGLTVSTNTRTSTIANLEVVNDTLYVCGGEVFFSTDKGESYKSMGLAEQSAALVGMSVWQGEAYTITYFGRVYKKRPDLPTFTAWTAAGTYTQANYTTFGWLAMGQKKIMLTGKGPFDITATPQPLALTGIAALEVKAMLALDTSKLVVGTSLGKIFRTADGGATWNEEAVGVNDGIACLARTDTALYASGSRSFWRGDLNAQNWKKIDSSLQFTQSMAAGPSGFFRYANGIHGSTDGGATWAKADSGFPANTMVKSFLTGAPGVFALSDSGIHRASDDGKTWSYARPWAPKTFATSGYVSGDTVLVTLKNNDTTRAVRSTDKGATWTVADSLVTKNEPLVSVFFDNAIVLGRDTLFAILTKGNAPDLRAGGPWRYALVKAGNKLFVQGREAVYTLDLTVPSVSILAGRMPEHSRVAARLLSKGRVAVEFTLPRRQAVQVEIFALDGKSLIRKDLGIREGGRHRADLAVAGLAANGPIFVRMTAR